MKENLKKIFQLLSDINDKSGGKLIESSRLSDVKENVIESLDTDFSHWDKACLYLNDIDISKEGFDKEEDFKHGIVYLGMSLLDISNDLEEIYDMLGEFNQNMLKKEGFD